MKQILVVILMTSIITVAAVADNSSEALIRRMIGARSDEFTVEQIDAVDGYDIYEIESNGKKIVLRGSSDSAVAAGFNAYLRDYCQAHVSWNCGDQLDIPSPLPNVSRKVRVVSPYKYRFAYNYCTHGYTQAWWDWPRWERELDFMAMQGINLALIIEGQEQVWIDALGSMGYSDAEVRKWLCMPSHQPWQYMSNMEDYGGPVPASLVKRRVELGRKIINRMRELGMEPVQQGYYGIIPSDFKKRFPNAKVHPQGRWGNQKRPDMLDPTDPEFKKLADAFYASQKKLFGKATFFAADPFHEGGATKGIDLPACAHSIFDAMQKAAPGSTWVFQSWGGNPRQPMLDALPKDQLLVLDLFCEYKENWRKRNQFGNTPWLWCSIHNFGGNNGLAANFDRIATFPIKALKEAGPGKGQMKGMGALMEGSEVSPMLWDMFFSQGWRSEAPDIDGWIRAYARRRYGADSADAVNALNILHRTAYSVPGGHGQFPHNSAVCARPSLNPNQKARAYTGTKPAYDTTEFAKAWQSLLKAAPGCSASDGYRYDVVDFGRQTLEDLGTRYHKAICAAWKAKDRKALELYSGRMLALIEGMDRLTGSRKELLFGVWQRDARAWGATKAESDLCEQNARALLTTWTMPQCWGDYANRQWSGLLKGFYLHRWQMWLHDLKVGADNNWHIDVNASRKRIQDWEYEWIEQRQTYASKPAGDEIAIAKQLFAEFGADALNPEFYTSSSCKILTEVKPADFCGKWEYKAAGTEYIREMLPDGTLKLYRNGKLYPGWEGFSWKLKGNTVELYKADGTRFGRHMLRDKNTLIFKGEHWGPAKKVE